MNQSLVRATVVASVTAVLLAGVVAPLAAAQPSADVPLKPIPQGRGYDRAVKFIGKAATPRPVSLPTVPTNPHMSPNGTSNIHNDTYMTDSYPWSGPLGKNTKVTSSNARGECASISFDSRGRLIAVCINVDSFLTLMSPGSMKILARKKLPNPSSASTAAAPRDYTEVAGAYFYLDNKDRAVVATATHHIIMYAVTGPPSNQRFVSVKDLDISSAMDAKDSIQSALPDFSGRIWFITKSGVVGNVDPTSGDVHHMTLADEQIANSFSMGEDGGIYVVSTVAMYRFDAASDGSPVVTWREEYDNTGVQKPGQKSAGSGTTPTIMSGGRVAIVDNADPENIVVYKTAADATDRVVCTEPVFAKGASATENSLIAIGNSLIVENNYGNGSLKATAGGRSTTPGMARVDVTKSGCTTTWVNTKVRAPSVVPKFSAKTGLIYTYTKPVGPGKVDRWYLTALDYRTGREVFSVLAGTGILYNNNYAAAYLSRTGVAYVGVSGGIVRFEG